MSCVFRALTVPILVIDSVLILTSRSLRIELIQSFFSLSTLVHEIKIFLSVSFLNFSSDFIPVSMSAYVVLDAVCVSLGTKLFSVC